MISEAFVQWWIGWLFSVTWQVAVFVLLVAVTAALTSKLSARLRYALWTLVLLKVFFPPSIGMPWSVSNLDLNGIREARVSTVFQHASSHEAVQPDGRAALNSEPVSAQAEVSTPPVTDEFAMSAPLLLALVWVFGALGYAGLAAWANLRLRVKLRTAIPVDEGPLAVMLQRHSLSLGLAKPPELLLSREVASPFLCGIRNPRIILPVALPDQISTSELENVFLHELMHCRRRDVLVAWFQAAVQALFWFHPLVWYANSQIDQERERACDESVLQSGKAVPRLYGQTLLQVLMAARGRATATPGFLGIFERNTKLQKRLETIMNQEDKTPRFGWGGVLFVALFAFAFLPMGNLIRAQGPSSVVRTIHGKAETESIGGAETLKYDDDKAEDRRSLGASGHAVQFSAPAGRSWITGVAISAARYGAPEAPQEDFHIYVMNERKQVLADVLVPYSSIQRGTDPTWYHFSFQPVEVTQQFAVGLAFNPSQRKGIYLGIDKNSSPSESLVGLPEDGYTPYKDTPGNWMVRAYMTGTPSEKAGLPLADWKEPVELNPFSAMQELKNDTEESAGKQSHGGRGPAIEFPLPTRNEHLSVNGIRIYGSRYGSGYAPEQTIMHLYVMTPSFKLLSYAGVPYSKFSFSPKWVDVRFEKPVIVDKSSTAVVIACDPQANQMRGIYFHYSKPPVEPHSYAGTTEKGYELLSDRQWMIRAAVSDAQAGAQAATPIPVGQTKTVASSTSVQTNESVETEPPVITATTPQVGAYDVPPGTSEITVTFDRDMGGGFSWTGAGPEKPKGAEASKPFWRDSKTCVYPVQLEEGKYYRVGINSTSFQNFRSKAGVPARPSAIYFTTQGASDELRARVQKPKIVSMEPPNGTTDVDPNIKEIRVTFDIPMGSGFSWVGEGPSFPNSPDGAMPTWSEDGKTCSEPVKLEPNKSYELGINSEWHKNFSSAAGVPADPVVYTFSTKTN